MVALQCKIARKCFTQDINHDKVGLFHLKSKRRSGLNKRRTAEFFRRLKNG